MADQFLLRILGVASGLHLSLVSTGECNAEHAEKVTIGGLGLHERLNEGVPLLHKGAELIAGDVHTIEVGEAVESLHFFDLELDLSPSRFVVFILQVSEVDIENATTQAVSCDLYQTKEVNKRANENR